MITLDRSGTRRAPAAPRMPGPYLVEEEMLTTHELHELAQELAETKVLTVYYDARVTDPAMRHAWRSALTASLRSARDAITRAEERSAFDRAASYLDAPSPSLDGTWGAPGWVAFLTTEGLQYGAYLPVRPSTFAVWRNGPVIAPYLRALKQQRAVVVALVDSRSARLYRYERATLTELPGVSLTASDESDVAASAAPRRALDTDHAKRRQLAAFHRLSTLLAARLSEAAGDDGWVLIGGTTRWAQMASDALPASLAARAMTSRTLSHDASAPVIEEAARRAATSLRATYGQALVHRLVEQASAGGRAAAGIPAVQRALRARAVDLLVVSPAFVNAGRYAELGEDAVRAAIAQGADVEVLSGEAATRLDQLTDGIGARLRFAIDAPPARRSVRYRRGPSRVLVHSTFGGDDVA